MLSSGAIRFRFALSIYILGCLVHTTDTGSDMSCGFADSSELCDNPMNFLSIYLRSVNSFSCFKM